jgi:hypothetical protein
MALTFTGTAYSQAIFGNDATTQNLFVITCGIASRKDVYIKRLCVYNDATAVLTAVNPLIKLSRCTSVSGGLINPKGTFDSTQTSDSAIELRTCFQNICPLVATAGTIIWESFNERMHTAVEQQRDDNGGCLIEIIENSPVILHPGQSVLLQLVGAVGTSNPITNNMLVNVEWLEYDITTFAISGTVTLSAVGVEGAKVIVVEADDTSLTNAVLREVITTPAGGAWSSTIRAGKVGAAFVQYTSGGTLYTAPGSPYLQ